MNRTRPCKSDEALKLAFAGLPKMSEDLKAIVLFQAAARRVAGSFGKEYAAELAYGVADELATGGEP